MCTVHTRTNASIHATTEPQPKECQKMGILITIIMTTEVTPLSLAQPRIHVCVLAERPTEWRGGGGMLMGRSERGLPTESEPSLYTARQRALIFHLHCIATRAQHRRFRPG